MMPERARSLSFAACLALGAGLACNGGQLDAFAGRDASAPETGGRAGTATGGSGNRSGTTSGGGEGGEGVHPELLLVDDFEDGDLLATLNQGQWFVAHDATGDQTLNVAMPAVELADSTLSLHASGVGFERFAAVVCDVAGDPATFDASNYAALTFLARAETDSNGLFAFLVGGQSFAVPLRFGTTWEPHTIRFTDVIAAEDGLPNFDPRAISGIEFSAPPRVSFDFWLDELAFVK